MEVDNILLKTFICIVLILYCAHTTVASHDPPIHDARPPDRQLENVIECNLLSGVVSFSALFLPCAFMLFIRFIQATLHPPTISGYEEVNNPMNNINRRRESEIEYALTNRLCSTLLFIIPSLLCAGALGTGSWYLCHYMVLD